MEDIERKRADALTKACDAVYAYLLLYSPGDHESVDRADLEADRIEQAMIDATHRIEQGF